MPNLRLISLNGNAGAFVDILATVPARKYDIMEDESVATQGIQVKAPMDGFANTYVFSFNSEPAQIPDPQRYPALGKVWGAPAQGQVGAFNAIAAGKLMSARSNGAAGTTVRFAEYE